MAEDIAPALLAAIRADFEKALAQIEADAATWPDAYDYAAAVGRALADALQDNLSSDILPDGRLYWNIADRVVRPLLEQDHALVADVAAKVQQGLNEAANLGLKAQTAKLDTDRVEGILNRVAAAERYDDVAWVLNEPVVTFSRSVVDETIRQNVEFQGGAGLHPRVIRKAAFGCCKWCSSLAGTYSYPNVPQDVWRRHENCNCTVEYDPGDGRRQTVHAKGDAAQRRQQAKRAQEKAKKEIQGIDTRVGVVRTAPQTNAPENVLAEYLRTAKPGEGTIAYGEGYNIATHTAEIKTAQWLHDNLGGDIELLTEAKGYKVLTPDYIWNGKQWELKNVTTAKAANSAVRHGLKQIQENPGGIILDYSSNTFSETELLSVLSTRMKASASKTTDILVIQKDSLVKALRYKK